MPTSVMLPAISVSELTLCSGVLLFFNVFAKTVKILIRTEQSKHLDWPQSPVTKYLF